MTKATYYVSTCPDTGRQFLCQVGVDGNIAELTPATVASMLVTHRQMEKTKQVLKQTREVLRKNHAASVEWTGA